MISDWQTFLAHRGAHISNNRITHFGEPERERKAVIHGRILCDLSHIGLIGLNGEEAAQFMQSQFSNDTMQVSETRSQLNAYCNPKGRMLADFRTFKRADDYFLSLPMEILEATLQRLRMYVLRTKVKLADGSDDLVRIGYHGPGAKEQLQTLVDHTPQQVDDCTTSAELTIILVPGPAPRYEIYGSLDAVKPLWERLAADATLTGASSWSLLNILAGIPTVLAQTREAFIPQMANMDLIGAINFKKGCYPGQEIVARMHYLGKLKRRMYRIHIDGATPPLPGEDIFIKEADKTQPAGKIVDAQLHPDGGSNGLAVLQISTARRKDIQLQTREGARTTIGQLPYALDISN
ncbi:MAG: folate-binding protein YgfZ [Gammaproteobacteria bacterium]|nr:folate-binding protein YgfZ [Gammaproteobacteria bacterium]